MRSPGTFSNTPKVTQSYRKATTSRLTSKAPFTDAVLAEIDRLG
jgi:hypothetical protein